MSGQEEISESLPLFSVRLRGARALRGLNQSKLAELLNVSLGAVGNWESGRNGAPRAVVEKISEILKVSPGWLSGFPGVAMEEDEPTSRPPPAPVTEMKEGETAYHTKPLPEEIRHYVNLFLQKCGSDERRLGWMLTELQSTFPLNKWDGPMYETYPGGAMKVVRPEYKRGLENLIGEAGPKTKNTKNKGK